MATSGTYGETSFPIITLIEEAHRLCKIPPQAITGEILDTARRHLYLMFTRWGNQQNLWTVGKAIIPQQIGKRVYDLPAGVLDIRTVLRRELVLSGGTSATSSAGGTVTNAFDQDLDTVLTQTSADGNVSVDFGSEVYVTTVGVCTNGARTYNLVWEFSEDNSTWTTVLATGSVAYTDREFAYYDITAPRGGRYFRVRETGGGTLNVRQIVFGRSPSEVSVTLQNRDDYYDQPDKTLRSDPTMFWYDKQVTPRIWVWPAPASDMKSLVIWYTRNIEDPGAFSNDMAIPKRWYEAALYGLAVRVARVHPGVDPGILQDLKMEADMALADARGADTDGSDFMITPNIGVYTR